jgi:hypothetical protein
MVGRENDGVFGSGGGIWLLIILFFIMFAGGGYGGFGNSASNQVTNDFLFNNLSQTLNQGFTQVANQSFGIQNALCQDFAQVNANLAEARYNQDRCCCETNRNIDSVRYENARNTCDIITANQANTQRIIDYMQNEKIDALRTELQSAQLQLSNNAQTATLINQLRPFPIPSYITCSPYVSSYGYAYGSGCGCNA